MKKYIVIALSVGALSNRIFSAGDEVSEDAFEPGRADDLVKKGFLKEIGAEKDEQEEEEEDETGVEVTSDPHSGPQNLDINEPENFDDQKVEDINLDSTPDVDPNAGPQDLAINEPENITTETPENIDQVEEKAFPKIDDLTKNQIINDLKAANVDFEMSASKKELYELWLKR